MTVQCVDEERKVADSFLTEIAVQLQRARDQLREAVRLGDDFLADAMFARLDQLRRLAADHGAR